MERLESLYREQATIYRRVREFGRTELEALRRGAPMAEIRNLLEQKKACLVDIGRLELTERRSKEQWRAGRAHWSPEAKARLHRSLREVSTVIEDIIRCEEMCDRELLGQCRGGAPLAAGVEEVAWNRR
ncbi:MAG: hypothetical protein R6X25_08830 [Candidatus Krumholzibacteriia bacterium]